MTAGRLTQDLFGATFQNPILLASGTCGYGRELDGLLDLDALGGIVIKATTPEPRAGNPAPRVAEYAAGMVNSIGLANVGMERCRSEKLPWLASRLRRAHVLVNVAGSRVEDYGQVIEALDDADGFLGYELNVSCPNVREGGAVFGTDPRLLADVVREARRRTPRPLLVKLSPNVPDVGEMASVCESEGADGLTLINTYPGLLFDLGSRRPVVGAGTGGVSGAGILPMGVHAVWRARSRVRIPVVGVGGIRCAEDALQYLLAGASLVAIGTATFADPRAPERVLYGLERYLEREGIPHVRELVGAGVVP